MNNKELFGLALQHRQINPFAAICQWSHETGNYTSNLAKNANNLAGIKKWSGYTGPTINVSSWEQKPDGTKTVYTSTFCSYPTLMDFVGNYAMKIQTNYPICVAQKDNFLGYFSGLMRGKWGPWATDHNYFRRLVVMAIKLAPEVFGRDWESKMNSAVTYAFEKKYLTAAEKAVVNELWKPSNHKVPEKTPFVALNTLHTVWIDAGHGGADPGAAAGGVNEKDINLEITNRLCEILDDAGYTVNTTRIKDSTVSLAKRTTEANKSGAEIFISLHANASDNVDAAGVEVYYLKGGSEESVALAGICAKKLTAILPPVNSNAKRRKTVKGANYHVLRETDMPAVLIEVGFLTNEKERNRLLNSIEEIAAGLAEAVNEYFSKEA